MGLGCIKKIISTLQQGAIKGHIVYCNKFNDIFKAKYKKRRKYFAIMFRFIEFRIAFFSTFQNVDNEAYITFIIKKIMRNVL